jgi:hypothetical protein
VEKDNGSANDQIKLFRSLFAGRNDAYGLETKNGHKAIREPLTDQIILSHLQGSARVGVYPLHKNELTVEWACIDVDEHDRAKVQRIIVALNESGFYPYVEASKAKGFHIWIFFDEPIEARSVRAVLTHILKQADINDVEIFPKQDGLTSDNAVGNFVFLPLHGGLARHGRTVFVDASFEPYLDQWDHLSRVHRTKTENILQLVGTIPDKPEKDSTSDDPKTGSLNVDAYLKHYHIPFRAKRDAGRTFYLLDRCLFADGHTTENSKGDSAIVQGSDGKLTYQCFHAHCQRMTWADARKAISGDDLIFQFCQEQESNQATQKQERSLTEDIRSWVENAFSKFTTEQIYRDLDINTPKDKSHIRTELHRMVEKGILDRGTVNGSFLKIESRSEEIQINDVVPVPLPVILPGKVHERVAIYRKNLLVGAGSSNGGKTAYGLNTAYENRDKFDLWYFTTEMDSDELTLRIHNFGYPIQEWNKVKFRLWQSAHSIKPDAFNILDYLEVKEGEFWRVGDDLRKIFEKLQGGIALVFIQMDRGRQYGWGGQKTMDKARLYFTLDDNKLAVVKGKNWVGKENPNGKAISFKLRNGSIFEWGSWS